jgi:hypothetical protein
MGRVGIRAYRTQNSHTAIVIVGVKYPGGRLRLANMEKIGSLQRQTAREPHALYHIKAPPPPSPCSKIGEGGPLTYKINNHLIDNSSKQSHGSTVEQGSQHHQADPRGIRASSQPTRVPLLPGKARPDHSHEGGGIHYLTRQACPTAYT